MANITPTSFGTIKHAQNAYNMLYFIVQQSLNA